MAMIFGKTSPSARPSMGGTSAHFAVNIDLGTFTADLTKFINKSKSNVNKVVRKAILDVFRPIVLTTPVDTGRCRSGWQLGKGYVAASALGGSPAQESIKWKKTGGRGGGPKHRSFGMWEGTISTVPRTVESAYGKSARGPQGTWLGRLDAQAGTFDKSGRSTVSQGKAIADTLEVTDGIIATIYNNVHYAIYLEFGHSQQAPQGMVRINLIKFVQSINAEAAKLNK